MRRFRSVGLEQEGGKIGKQSVLLFPTFPAFLFNSLRLPQCEISSEGNAASEIFQKIFAHAVNEIAIPATTLRTHFVLVTSQPIPYFVALIVSRASVRAVTWERKRPCALYLFIGRIIAVFAVALVLSAMGIAAENSLKESPPADNASATQPTKAFNIPAGDAAIALKKFSEQSGLSVMFAPERVEGITTREVVGEMSTRVALDKLLAGTSLYAIRTKEPGAYAIRREGPTRPNG